MLEKVKELLAEQLKLDVETINEDTNLKEDLGVDSLDLFEIVMGLEEEFNISINNEDLEQIKTVQDALNYIKERQEA